MGDVLEKIDELKRMVRKTQLYLNFIEIELLRWEEEMLESKER